MRLGDYSVLYEDESCLIFSRKFGAASCLAGFNFSPKAKTIPGLVDSRLKPDLAVGTVQVDGDDITLGPVSAFLISKNPL